MRRLTAILAADVVGFSRLMAINESVTLEALREHRREIVSPLTEQHRGRLVKLMGDGMLLAFASVLDALRFAIATQRETNRRAAQTSPDRRILLRIGVTIGDIIIEGEDIYGDRVNLAARLEKLAEPGGICVAGIELEPLRGELDVGFQSLGRRRVKNIPEALLMHRVLLAPEHAGRILHRPRPIDRIRALPPRAALGASLALLVTALGLSLWLAMRPTAPMATTVPASLSTTGLPSIAVLPFRNLGPATDQDHFADGLTNDLIVELSKISGMLVIARHSAFALQEDGEAAAAAAALGVKYVLSGSVQRAGDIVRINVQLLDAKTGVSRWAERYDRDFADIFALQDEVIGKIAEAASVSLTETERRQLAKIPTANLEAYDNYLRAEKEGAYFADVGAFRRALGYYAKAITLDPAFADAYSGIARIAVDVWRNDQNFLWTAAVARQRAYEAAGMALKLDPLNARAYGVLSLVQLVDGHRDEAIESARKSVSLTPNDAEALANMALVLVSTGASAEGVAALEKALLLEPAPSPHFELLAGVVLSTAGLYDRAAVHLANARDAEPRAETAREHLAAAYAMTGYPDEAHEELAALLALFPAGNLAYYAALYDYLPKVERGRHLSALRQAGLPDWPFGFQGAPADRLGGDELRALSRSVVWSGRHMNGAGFVQEFDGSGGAAYRSANTILTGRTELRDDALCERFDGAVLDRTLCGPVFRNSGYEGAPAEGAEYVHVSPSAVRFFSVTQR